MASVKGDKGAEEAVLEVLKRFPEGCGQEVFDKELSHVSLQARADALNRLLSRSSIQLLSLNHQLVYKEVSQEDAVRFRNLTAEELMLYQVIKSAGNTGLWTKDMRSKTNLAQPHITKILKTLENRKLVKAVKSVNNPSRKVFMLYELDPSRELTGGAWYTENQFDAEFIEVLREACYKYIQHQGDTTVHEVADFIRKKGFSKVDLRIEDIHSIINTLIYDGRIDQVDGEGDDDMEDHFRLAVHNIPASNAFTATPCGVCPVIGECVDGGTISPQTCVYFDKWLEF